MSIPLKYFHFLLALWVAGGSALWAGQKKPLHRNPAQFAPRQTGTEGERAPREEAADIERQRLAYPGTRPPTGDWRSAGLAWIMARVPDGVPAGARTLRVGGGALAVPPGTAWTRLGPQPFDMTTATGAGFGYGIVTGRVNAIAVDPANPAVAYAGMPTGGLWKTTTCCGAATTWTPLWDGPDFPAQSVGAIALDPGNSQIIYAGTGDSQATPGDEFGTGIFKSTDGGASWMQYGATLFSPYGAPGAPACGPA